MQITKKKSAYIKSVYDSPIKFHEMSVHECCLMTCVQFIHMYRTECASYINTNSLELKWDMYSLCHKKIVVLNQN